MSKKLELNTGIQVIGIGGYKGSGKDTLGNHLVDHINEKGERHAIRIGFADALKVHCVEKYGVDLELCHADNHTKNTTLTGVNWFDMPREIQEKFRYSKADDQRLTYRELLQIEGTELGRDKFGEDIWLEKITENINSIESDKPLTIIITDVRFDNEAQYIMSNGGHVIRILSTLNNRDAHSTEMGITRYNYEVEGFGKTSLKNSQRDIETLYGYINLHERVRDFVEEENK